MTTAAFNFVIAGVEAHATNVSVLIGSGGVFRLAPIYDVMSTLHYDQDDDDKLAMNVGTEGAWKQIRRSHWEKEAKACKYPVDEALAYVRHFTEVLPDAASDMLKTCRAAGLETEVLPTLVDVLAKRCADLKDDY